MLRGSVRLSYGGGLTLEKRDVIFFDAGEQVAVQPPFDGSVLALLLEPEYFREGMGAQNPIVILNSVSVRRDYAPLVEYLRRFAEAYFSRTEDSWAGLMSQYYGLLDLLKDFTQTVSGETAAQGTDAAPRAKGLEDYINLHYREPLSLKELASVFYLSPTYLSKYFTKNFGINFYAYLQNVRLEQTVRELMLGKSSIAKAALDNGFSSLSAFNTVFKRKYGMQPAKYLKLSARERPASWETGGEESAAQDARYEDIAESLGALAEPAEEKVPTADTAKREVIRLEGGASVKEGTPLTAVWQEIINLDDAADCLNNEFQNQFIAAQKVLCFRYARVCGIIELLARCDTGSADWEDLNFSDFNRIVNFLLSTGVKPFFELGSKPLKTDATPGCFYFNPSRIRRMDEGTWEVLIERLMRHCVNYWGVREVSGWRFELWIRHSEQLTIDRRTILSYARYFAITQRIIKSMVPDAWLGGPGLNLGGISIFDSMEQILRSLREQDLRPDFISAYLYPGCDAESSFEGTRQKLQIKLLLNTDEETNINKIKNLTRSIRASYPDVPIYLTEFGSDVVSRSTVNETCYKSAFIAKTAIDMCDKVDAMGYWLFSDLTQEHKDARKIVFGGNGLVSRYGIRKSGYFAFWFLSKLGGTMIDRGKNYIVTRSDAGCRVLVHNYKNLSDAYCTEYFRAETMIPGKELFEDVKPLQFCYRLRDVQPGSYAVKKYTLNAYHGNLADLVSELNCWERARDEEIEYLSGVCVPRQRIEYMESEGELELKSTLEPLEVILFTVDRNF